MSKSIPEMSRHELESAALKMGLSAEVIKTKSNPRLKELLQDGNKSSRKNSRVSRKSIRHDTHMAYVSPEIQQQQVVQYDTHPEDDNKTIVDTSYIANTHSRSDERFERVKQLLILRKQLQERLSTNSKVEDTQRSKWEEDTMVVHQTIMQRDQEYIALITNEITEHYRFFVDTCTEKEEEFKHTLSVYKDTEDGLMFNHLKRKIQNQRYYLDQIKKEAGL